MDEVEAAGKLKFQVSPPVANLLTTVRFPPPIFEPFRTILRTVLIRASGGRSICLSESR